MRETAVQIAADIATGRRKAADVCAAALERTERHNSQLGAFLQLTPDIAWAQAAKVDAAIAAGEPVGPLAGVPIAIKDNLCTTFGKTTCASRILADYASPYDATAVRRVVDAGAVVIGKTNLDEFAMGSSTENSAFTPTRNPWDPARAPGGSSGGSAVAVVAGMSPIALGSDTGGSIRQPAALCGAVGLKPTYGRVSRYGLLAYGSSLDQIGPLATSVEDAALLLEVISGKDAADSTSVDKPVPAYRAGLNDAALDSLAEGLRVGVPQEYFGEGLDPETRAAVEAALAVYEELGAEIVPVSLPHAPYAIAAYYVIVTSEASSNLARYDGVHYGHRAAGAQEIVELYSASRSVGFGAEVKRRIMLGTFALSAGYYDAYYDKALKVRRLIKGDLDAALARCDVLAGPASPTPAFPLGEKVDDPLAMFLLDIYTISLNLAGLPGITLPCGFTESGLPIGLQLMAPVFDEQKLLQAARLYERATDWHAREPALS